MTTKSLALLRAMERAEKEIADLLGVDPEHVEIDHGGVMFHMSHDELLAVLRTLKGQAQ